MRSKREKRKCAKREKTSANVFGCDLYVRKKTCTHKHTYKNRKKERERQRSMKKWKHEPSLFLWTLLHLVLLQSHTHTHLCNKLPVLSLLQIHTHARRCLHSNLKTFPSTTLCYLSTPTYTQWIHVTVPGVCVCVLICIHPCVSNIRVCLCASTWIHAVCVCVWVYRGHMISPSH